MKLIVGSIMCACKTTKHVITEKIRTAELEENMRREANKKKKNKEGIIAE